MPKKLYRSHTARLLTFRLYPTKAQESMLTKYINNAEEKRNQMIGILSKKTFDPSMFEEERDFADSCLYGKRKKNTYGAVHFDRDDRLLPEADAIKGIDKPCLEPYLFEWYNYICGRTGKPVTHKVNGYGIWYRYYSTVLPRMQIVRSMEQGYFNFGMNIMRDNPTLSHVKMDSHPQEVSGSTHFVGVLRKPSGKFYLIVRMSKRYPKKVEIPPPTEETTIGIDLGLKDLATLSNGIKYPLAPTDRTALSRIARFRQRLKFLEPGTKQHWLMSQKIEEQREHLMNVKREYLHQITTQIANMPDVRYVVIENLDYKTMGKNKRMGLAVRRAHWGKFVKMLSYKLAERNKVLIKAKKNFPSSQLCSSCGYRHPAMTLGIREWACPQCGTIHDRDANAAINLQKYGSQTLPLRGTES